MLSAAAREAAGVTALVVNSDSPVGLTLAIEQPETLGADILAADAAAAEEYPLPVIVFDFGTATTVTVVDEQRRYRGGVILPGIKLGMQALFTGTAPAAGYPDRSAGACDLYGDGREPAGRRSLRRGGP